MKRVYQSENQSLLFIVILGSLTAFGPLAIDMFLPGLPNISHDFDISASTTQLTISFFMIGLALGNFLAGPISDITGRKKTINFLTDYFYYCEFRYYIRHKYMDYDYFTIYSRINWWCRCSHLKSHC